MRSNAVRPFSLLVPLD
jgi:hypothetical protein